VTVFARVDDFNHHNAEAYLRAAEPDLILDGLDNFATRYLLNDLAVKHGLPFIHGGAVGTTGTVLTILPHPARRVGESRSAIRWTAQQATPCLRCVFPEPPSPGSGETCDTAGVLGPLVMLIAARQATEAIKLITGDLDAADRADRRLTRFEDVRLLRRSLRDAVHRNHPPLATLLHWHYVRAGELFSIIPLKGLADVRINGGMPFDLPVMKGFFVGEDGLWPSPEDLSNYPSFLDAHIRHRRVNHLLQSIEGIGVEEARSTNLIPGDAVVREFIGGSTLSIPHNE
jgi:adenylyltransferase/sulfurtransferase